MDYVNQSSTKSFLHRKRLNKEFSWRLKDKGGKDCKSSTWQKPK